jgi:elongation factor 1 alpha-like protein
MTLGAYLVSIGFREKNIRFIPISGLLGENLHEKSTLPELSWYDGPCLIDMIGKFNLTSLFNI